MKVDFMRTVVVLFACILTSGCTSMKHAMNCGAELVRDVSGEFVKDIQGIATGKVKVEDVGRRAVTVGLNNQATNLKEQVKAAAEAYVNEEELCKPCNEDEACEAKADLDNVEVTETPLRNGSKKITFKGAIRFICGMDNQKTCNEGCSSKSEFESEFSEIFGDSKSECPAFGELPSEAVIETNGIVVVLQGDE